MKAILFVASLLFSATTIYASNHVGVDPVVKTVEAGNGSVNKALAAIKSSCPDAQGNLTYSVQTVSACFVDGFVRKVTFWRTPNCPPNTICIQSVIIVGTVTLDCNDNVISVTCGAGSEI